MHLLRRPYLGVYDYVMATSRELGLQQGPLGLYQKQHTTLLLKYAVTWSPKVCWDRVVSSRGSLDCLYGIWNAARLLPFYMDRLKARASLSAFLEGQQMPRPHVCVVTVPMQNWLPMIKRWCGVVVRLVFIVPKLGVSRPLPYASESEACAALAPRGGQRSCRAGWREELGVRD